jgi:hypothetical protein
LEKSEIAWFQAKTEQAREGIIIGAHT